MFGGEIPIIDLTSIVFSLLNIYFVFRLVKTFKVRGKIYGVFLLYRLAYNKEQNNVNLKLIN